jgi:hypothetical protein
LHYQLAKSFVGPPAAGDDRRARHPIVAAKVWISLSSAVNSALMLQSIQVAVDKQTNHLFQFRLQSYLLISNRML